MSDDKFKVTYQLISTMKNSGMEEHPDRNIEIIFDGTDVTLSTVVSQIETFLKASGYFFDHLEIVK
jgi:hypothetical protein